MNEKRYAWNPDDYSAQSHAQYQWALEIVEKLGLRGWESVLDIGCGDGKVTALIGSHLPHGNVTGIDSSSEMVERARETFPPSRYPQVSFLHMDAMNLMFWNKFDLAFSNAVLHWVTDHGSMLRGVERSLKRSGKVFFQMGGSGNARDIIDTTDILIQNSTWRRYFTGFTIPYTFLSPEEYEILLRDAALIPLRVELIPKDMTQNGKDGLTGWIRTTWLPYTERIPEDRRDRFISELADTYLKKFPPDSEGRVHVRMVRLEVEALKP